MDQKIIKEVKNYNDGKEPFNFYFLKGKVEALCKLMNEIPGAKYEIDDNFIKNYWMCHYVTQHWDCDFDKTLEN